MYDVTSRSFFLITTVIYMIYQGNDIKYNAIKSTGKYDNIRIEIQ
jgi:hypothetical protein